MNILSETKELLKQLKVPIETGIFSQEAPSEYIVLIPLADTYPLNADDMPQADNQELRISIFTKRNYIKLKNQITSRLLAHYFYITDRSCLLYTSDAADEL